MNNEAMEARKKVLKVYPDAELYLDLRGGFAVGSSVAGVTVGDGKYTQDAAWVDAASRLPARPAKEKICKHCGPTCIPGAAHNARTEDGVIWKPEDDLPARLPARVETHKIQESTDELTSSAATSPNHQPNSAGMAMATTALPLPGAIDGPSPDSISAMDFHLPWHPSNSKEEDLVDVEKLIKRGLITPVRVEEPTHEFVRDGTGVCGKCGRERSNTKYHPITIAPSPIPSATREPAKEEFLLGFAIALSTVNRQHDQPTIVKDAIEGNGLTLKMFKDAGVEEYDLKELRKCPK